jgi:hypothetical protein
VDDLAGSALNPLSNQSKSGTPESARWLNVVLLATALVAWLTFVIACVSGPAWSPDSSKILFGYYDEGNSRLAIALYDRSAHKTRNLFVAVGSEKDKPGVMGLVPAWQADGTRSLIGVSSRVPGDDDPHCSLVSIPIKSEVPLQLYDFGKGVACWSPALMPQIGDTVYLVGDDGLTWLNLTTGKADSKKFSDEAPFIAGHNGQLVYFRTVSRPAPTAENKNATEDGLELGQVDLKDVTLKPYYSLWKTDADIEKLEEDLGASWEPGGTRIAMVLPGDKRDGIVLLDEKKKVIGNLAPDLGVKEFHLGMAVWAHDGKTLYVPAIVPTDREKQYTYSLAEIPLSGAPGRLTRIADFEWKSSDDVKGFLYLGMQVSLSPDGKTIAATTATMSDGVAKADRALFLIDVQRPERRIKRIPPPKSTKSH